MFIISEIFPQHSGSLEVAEQMILQSKMAGADAVKIQLYTATQFGAERAYLELSKDGLKRLNDYALTLRIPLFATPFTLDRLEWCIDLDLPYLKVAARMHRESPELVKKIMSYKKPTFVSIPSDLDTGEVKKYDHSIYLYCVMKYPTRVDEFQMPDFSNSLFHGISDHTLGNAGALFASAHGAQYLEKHFTLRKSFQYETEKAHLGAMNMDDLAEIKQTAFEFERIRKAIGLDK
ncbi:MAG: N-acetylneuraminate synthase family protein [Flavobacteriales bacterium]|nr:N-acetylneuraminate synthase family protein [Flavobacteriales bacterium]